MMQSSWSNCLRRCAQAGVVGTIVFAASTSTVVRAQDDNPNDNALARFERKVWDSITRGIGLRGSEPQIDYRERSPLVVPPTRDLPPPQAKAAARSPEWPVDPDAKRAKDRADAKKKKLNAGNPFFAYEENMKPLTPDQLNPTGSTRPAGSAPAAGSTGPEPQGNRLLPSELGYFGGLFSWTGMGFGPRKPEVGTFTHEPPRNALTAPPSGYQTPSGAFPYGITPRIEYGKAEAHDPGR